MNGLHPEEHELDPQGGYDPELPFLYALEREIARRAHRAYETREHQRLRALREQARTRRGGAGAPLGASAGTGARRRGGKADGARRRSLAPAGVRMARRSLTLVALLCLIGASAYGAGRIFSGGAPSPAAVTQSAFVRVAGGDSGPDRWSLRVYLRGDELCRVLVVADAESSRCSAPPDSHSLGVTSVVSPTRRYVYGIAGVAVARVSVHAGSAHASAPTRPLGAAAAAVGLSRRERWFVVILPRPVGEPDPSATVQAVDAAGNPLGAPVSDCAEGTETQRCPR